MPQSKNRKSHKQHADYIPHQKKNKSVVPVAVILCVILALGTAWFATEGSIIGLVIGAVVGGLIGFWAGREMDKAFAKK